MADTPASNPQQPIRRYKPGISVVIATCNGERYLAEQLESVGNQTLPPTEIIISDDASRDGTDAIIQRFVASSEIEVRYLRNVPGLGFGDNFLAAASLATCELVAFCDQDDVWHVSKLAECQQHFSSRNVSMVVHAAELINNLGKPIGHFRQGIRRFSVKTPLSYDLWSTFWGFSVVFRREVIDLYDWRSRFIDYIEPTRLIAHDRWVCFLCQITGSTVEVPLPLVQYRQHGSNLYGKDDEKVYKFANIEKRSDIYLSATRSMLDIIENISPIAETIFPLFSRERARAVVTRGLSQQIERRKIYTAPTVGAALSQLARNLAGGAYLGAHDQKIRLRSIGADLRYIVEQRSLR